MDQWLRAEARGGERRVAETTREEQGPKGGQKGAKLTFMISLDEGLMQLKTQGCMTMYGQSGCVSQSRTSPPPRDFPARLLGV